MLKKENYKCLAPFHQGDLTRLHEDYMGRQSIRRGTELIWVNFLWKGSWSPTSHNVEPKTKVIYTSKACDNCFSLRTRLDDPNKPLMLAFSNTNLTWLPKAATAPKGWYARVSLNKESREWCIRKEASRINSQALPYQMSLLIINQSNESRSIILERICIKASCYTE